MTWISGKNFQTMHMLNNGKLIFFICNIAAVIIIYLLCFPRHSKRKVQDLFVLGHVFFLSLLLFALYSCAFYLLAFRPHLHSFRQDGWKKNIESRSEMVSDLLNSRLLSSKSARDVTRLLGDPVRRYRNRDNVLTYAYYIGFNNKPFSITPSFLMIEFRDSAERKSYLKEGFPYTNNGGDSLNDSRVYFN